MEVEECEAKRNRSLFEKFECYIQNQRLLTQKMEKRFLDLSIMSTSYENVGKDIPDRKKRMKQVSIILLLIVNVTRTILLSILPESSKLVEYLGDNYSFLGSLKYPLYLGLVISQLQSLFVRILLLVQERDGNLSVFTDGPVHEAKAEELASSNNEVLFVLKLKIWLAYQCGNKLPRAFLLVLYLMEYYSAYCSNLNIPLNFWHIFRPVFWCIWVTYPYYLVVHDIIFIAFASLTSVELLKMRFDRLNYVLDNLMDTSYRIGPGIEHTKEEVYSVLNTLTHANFILGWILFYMINFNTVTGASYLYLTFSLTNPFYKAFFASASLTLFFFIQYIPARMASIASKVSIVYKKLNSVYSNPVLNKRMKWLDRKKMQLLIELTGTEQKPVCVYSLSGVPFLRINQWLIVVELLSNSMLFAQLYD